MLKQILAVILLCSITPHMASCQNNVDAINNINLVLKEGKITISKILSSDSLMYLHSLTPFREIIKENARAEKISIVADREPGPRITISGSIMNKKGEAQKNVLIYFYQTSDKGWYSDTGVHILMNSGDMKHARLFGYLRTDDRGEFSFETIKPNGYPRSDLAAHIHIHFRSDHQRTLIGAGELQFDDDPRMTASRRARSLAEGFLISKNTGTAQKPLYAYRIIVE